jgi:hypothetical protein
MLDYCRLLVFKADGKPTLAFEVDSILVELNTLKMKIESLSLIHSLHCFFVT